MDTEAHQTLRSLINVIDELRDLGLEKHVELPRICVVGTQSAGKSSVLEAIVGIDFLPRGEGVVTRVPLELRLKHMPESQFKPEDAYAAFEGEGKKFTDFEELRKAINERTDQIAGRNKGIVDHSVKINVFGVQCPDLTLIDLPGITRVPLKGSDQTDDIEALTRRLATRFAEDARTIILAVIPANADMSTSDALQLARKVDPQGLRTIGVITKIDLMDRGLDARKMLAGEEVPLRLGYTGVKNRSQADISAKKSIAQAIEDERAYFVSHPVYRSLPPPMLGVKSLVDKLTRVLFRHIVRFLPSIKREISQRMRQNQGRLDELGSGVPMEVPDRVQLMWSMITDYVEIFKNTIRGKYDKRLQTYFEHQDIVGGAQIRTIFNELLGDFMERDVTSEMTEYDIDSAIRMHEGDSLPGFPSPDTFEYLILPHLKKIQAPVMDCLDRVSQSLELLSQKIANRVFGRFPLLAQQVLEQSQTILLREKENTKAILEHIVDAETGYLFTNDAHYLTEHGSMLPMHERANPQYDNSGRPITVGPDGQLLPGQQSPLGNPLGGQQPPPQKPNSSAAHMINQMQQAVSQSVAGVTGMWGNPQDKDKRKPRYSGPFIKEIRKRLDSYFYIVIRSVRDTVPKTIGFFLVRQVQEKLQFELYNDLTKGEKMAELLGEPPHIMEERKKLMNDLDMLKKGAQILQRDPNITAASVEDMSEAYETEFRQHNYPSQPQSFGPGPGPYEDGGVQGPPPGHPGGGYPGYPRPPAQGGQSGPRGNMNGSAMPSQGPPSGPPYPQQGGPAGNSAWGAPLRGTEQRRPGTGPLKASLFDSSSSKEARKQAANSLFSQ